jgi:hypothetical protein
MALVTDRANGVGTLADALRLAVTIMTDTLFGVVYRADVIDWGDINTGTWPSRLGESQMRQ